MKSTSHYRSISDNEKKYFKSLNQSQFLFPRINSQEEVITLPKNSLFFNSLFCFIYSIN